MFSNVVKGLFTSEIIVKKDNVCILNYVKFRNTQNVCFSIYNSKHFIIFVKIS